MLRTLLTALVAGLVALPAAAQEPTLEQVLEGYYTAIGGVENWKAVGSARYTGKLAVPAQAVEAPFTMLMKRPLKSRIEFEVQGVTGIQAFDGETAWMLMPFMGRTEPELMPSDQARNMEEQSDFDGELVDYAAKGHAVELVGRADVDGTAAYELKVTRKDGTVQHHFLDAEYYLPIKLTGKRTMQGREIDFETVLSDYKAVGGLMFPHAIETRVGPATQILSIESIELNVPVEDSVFVMPKN